MTRKIFQLQNIIKIFLIIVRANQNLDIISRIDKIVYNHKFLYKFYKINFMEIIEPEINFELHKFTNVIESQSANISRKFRINRRDAFLTFARVNAPRHRSGGGLVTKQIILDWITRKFGANLLYAIVSLEYH